MSQCIFNSGVWLMKSIIHSSSSWGSAENWSKASGWFLTWMVKDVHRPSNFGGNAPIHLHANSMWSFSSLTIAIWSWRWFILDKDLNAYSWLLSLKSLTKWPSSPYLWHLLLKDFYVSAFSLSYLAENAKSVFNLWGLLIHTYSSWTGTSQRIWGSLPEW